MIYLCIVTILSGFSCDGLDFICVFFYDLFIHLFCCEFSYCSFHMNQSEVVFYKDVPGVL